MWRELLGWDYRWVQHICGSGITNSVSKPEAWQELCLWVWSRGIDDRWNQHAFGECVASFVFGLQAGLVWSRIFDVRRLWQMRGRHVGTACFDDGGTSLAPSLVFRTEAVGTACLNDSGTSLSPSLAFKIEAWRELYFRWWNIFVGKCPLIMLSFQV